MQAACAILIRLYRALLRCYPPAFRSEFEAEMAATFAQALAEAARMGLPALLSAFLIELKDWPLAILREQAGALLQRRIPPMPDPSNFIPGLLPLAPAGRPAFSSWITRRPALRRAFDLILAGLGLALVSPLMLLAALTVRLDSPGPVLFRQARLGRGRRVYTMTKFRTMVDDPATGGKALTRSGRVLRRLYLDETPQLVDVLRGDISIFGPRPEKA
jgi:hypothetical protein